MRIFAFMGIIFNGYLDIWTSWIFGHHGYLDIMDIWTSWIFGHHGYSDIMDTGVLRPLALLKGRPLLVNKRTNSQKICDKKGQFSTLYHPKIWKKEPRVIIKALRTKTGRTAITFLVTKMDFGISQGAVVGPKNGRQYPSCEARKVSQGYPWSQLKLTVDIFHLSLKPHVKPHLLNPQETCRRQKASFGCSWGRLKPC